jgi:hypothetical protein
MKKKILFVAMSDSIHTARWIDQIIDQKDWKIYLFPSFEGMNLHQKLNNVTIINSFFFNSFYFQKLFIFTFFHKLVLKIYNKFFPGYYERKLLKFINYFQPDLIHTLETQGAGYLMASIYPKIRGDIPWWHTNWGSDFLIFGNLLNHELIRKVLNYCDYYSCECLRDVHLAHDFGFQGKVFPVYPNTGGFDLNKINTFKNASVTTSKRRSIILKGYQGWAGRALVAIRALDRCADLLSGYTLIVYSNTSSEEIIIATALLSKKRGITVRLIPEGTDHEEILKLQSQSRIYIGLSIGDAISTSLLESMAMGSFPIQSCTACANEWIQDGVTGFIVPPEDPEIIEKALREALLNDELVDSALLENFKTINCRVNSEILKKITINSYKSILG